MAATTKKCSNCGKDFLVIDPEQQFLQEKGLALPDNCPSCRQTRRLTLRGSERALYKTKCQKCGKDIVVAFNPATVKNQILCKADFDQYYTENDPIITDPLPEA